VSKKKSSRGTNPFICIEIRDFELLTSSIIVVYQNIPVEPTRAERELLERRNASRVQKYNAYFYFQFLLTKTWRYYVYDTRKSVTAPFLTVGGENDNSEDSFYARITFSFLIVR